MASLEEFVSAVQSSIESLKQAQASMDNPKQQAEELSSQFQGLGAESMATGSQGLKQGVEQTQGMVPPIITQLEQIITSAQGMKNNGLRTATPEVRPPPTPLDAAPPALREPVAQIGDPVTAPEEKPGAFRAELKSSDDDDQGMSKFRRFGRTAVRNSGAIKDQLKTTAEVRFEKARDFDPPDSYPTVGVAPPPPQIHAANTGLPPQDIVSNVALLAVVAAEGISRLLGKGEAGRK